MMSSGLRAGLVLGLALALAGCGAGSGLKRMFSVSQPGGGTGEDAVMANPDYVPQKVGQERRSTIWDLFSNSDDPNITVEVNKYLWQASLEVLDFLPIQTVDPFSGVIVTGYGTPPGGGRAYRAIVQVKDPSLDARALKVALERRGGGAVPPETVRAVEDAILTRARQLRIRDGKL